ncbi:hypothetical protein GW916_05110 [bacterium]|nr:hypothetical protein [bacterium]
MLFASALWLTFTPSVQTSSVTPYSLLEQDSTPLARVQYFHSARDEKKDSDLSILYLLGLEFHKHSWVPSTQAGIGFGGGSEQFEWKMLPQAIYNGIPKMADSPLAGWSFLFLGELAIHTGAIRWDACFKTWKSLRSRLGDDEGQTNFSSDASFSTGLGFEWKAVLGTGFYGRIMVEHVLLGDSNIAAPGLSLNFQSEAFFSGSLESGYRFESSSYFVKYKQRQSEVDEQALAYNSRLGFENSFLNRSQIDVGAKWSF